MNSSYKNSDSTILVVDDTPDNISVILDTLGSEGYKVLVSRDSKTAFRQAKLAKPDLILLDIMMPVVDGFEVCNALKDDEKTKEIPVIFMTSLTDVENKITGFDAGAVDYISKPFNVEEVLARVRTHLKIKNLQVKLKEANGELEIRVNERTEELTKTNQLLQIALAKVEALKNRLEAENVYLQEEIKNDHNFNEIISQGDAFKKVFQRVNQIAKTDSTVLILGETGTGKELIARALHSHSHRSQFPLVKVNCATLPPNLIESELFGHEKGAFTGALSQKIGRFELANEGTIFLDEIGDLPTDMQAKLLRVLQEREFERLGNPKSIKVDVRVIAATNRDLEAAIKNQEFRSDLYYRLNVIPLHIPPLRERTDDILLLVRHFLQKNCAKLGKKIYEVPQEIMDSLLQYSWPGNVRELENLIERTAVLSSGSVLKLDDFEILGRQLPASVHIADINNEQSLSESNRLEDVEKNHIIKILTGCQWSIEGAQGAASILAMNPSTLRSKMKKLKIARP